MAKKLTLQTINKKLDEILKNQKKILFEELEQEEIEKKILKKEKKELNALEQLKKLEKEIIKDVGPHPLKNFTIRDGARGIIGAFFGAVAHYTFIYGLKVAESIDVYRAGILYLLSFLIGGIFLYATGFRKIKDPKLLKFLPMRLTVLYITAILMSIIVLILFNPHFGQDFIESYKQVATVSLTAIIGACTADLIGTEKWSLKNF